MTTVPSAHGALVSFGSSNLPAVAGDRLTFSGSGSLSADPDNTAAVQVFEPVDTIAQRTGQTFGVTLAGTSSRPQKDNSLTFQYWLAVAPGTADADVWPAFQVMTDALWAWFFGTYDYANADGSKTYSGASGMAGDLVVEDAAGVAQVCAADWDSYTMQLVPGEPDHYQMTVVLTQLSAMTAQPAPATSGDIETFAGDGSALPSPPIPSGINKLSFGIDAAQDVVCDSTGAVYWCAGNVVYVVANGATTASLYAGTTANSAGYSGDSGLATAAELDFPAGLAIDSSDNLYIADQGNHAIRKVAHGTGIITTVAGGNGAGSSGDGAAATAAKLNYPQGVCVASNGDIYIADEGNNKVRKVTHSTGFISTFAGNGTAGFSGDGGAATSAELSNAVWNLALSAAGDVYISDSNNGRVRVVDHSTGHISSYIGPSAATITRTVAPLAIKIDSGVLTVPDPVNGAILSIVLATNTLTVIAGTGTPGFSGDGGPATAAQLNTPNGQARNPVTGDLFIADTGNNRIRRVLA